MLVRVPHCRFTPVVCLRSCVIPSPQVLYLLHLHQQLAPMRVPKAYACCAACRGSGTCPASCSPVCRRRCAWHRRSLSERAACSMRTIMHRACACFVSRMCVLLNHARARAVCISQVWAETYVIEPVSLNCLDQAAKTSLGHCVPPGSTHHDLRPRSLPWVMLCDLRVRHSTRLQMI